MKKNNKSKQTRLTGDYVLDPYEQEIEDSLDIEDISDGGMLAKDRELWANAAKRHVDSRKSRRVTFSVDTGELSKFRTIAQEKGLPYQTLLNIIIKHYNDEKFHISL